MTDAPEPFDRADLRKCTLCGRGMMECGSPVFYEITARTCALDFQSIQQQAGMEMLLGGNAAVAAAMSPTTTVAHRLPATRHLVCAECALGSEQPVARFIESDDEPEDAP